MNVSRQLKDELNALSKEVFGASSRWQKLVTKGYTKIVTKEETEVVPAAKEGEVPIERKVQVPVTYGNKGQLSTIEYHTVESVRAYMLERKEALDKIRAEIKRQQDEARAKREKEQLAAKVHNELAGAAV